MGDCCSGNTCSSSKSCPKCHKQAKSVALQTIFHQLKFPDVLNVEEGEYYFCSDDNCLIAYFTAADKLIYKQQLSVFAKENSRKLCYCFNIDKAFYVDAVVNNKAETIKQFVIQKTKAGLCACAIKNPSGRCCLADFKKLTDDVLEASP